MHQNYRAAAMPETEAVIALLRKSGHAAVVSGAGPSVLVLASDRSAPRSGQTSSPKFPTMAAFTVGG